MRLALVLCLGAALILPPAPAGAQAVTLESILAHAAWYTVDFVDRFANVVAEETYWQESTNSRITASGAALSARRRQLKSDFLLVKPEESTDWQPFRDVFEVDGRAVRDRGQRLEKLFLTRSRDAIEQARRIADESARYNIGNIARTVNNPVLGAAMLQARNHGRMRFRLHGRDPDIGPNVYQVSFEETATPSLIRGSRGRDVKMRGRAWIDAPSGRIERTELSLQDPLVRAKLTTIFTLDERFQIGVPTEMRDEYFYGGTIITGRATYSRFRRFSVTAEEQFAPAPPQ